MFEKKTTILLIYVLTNFLYAQNIKFIYFCIYISKYKSLLTMLYDNIISNNNK